jgi:hypothetical protein
MPQRAVPCGVLLAAGLGLGLVAAPAPVQTRPEVEVVFCLDTTASMGPALETVRAAFWAISNGIACGRPTPVLRIGLVAFRDRGDEFVTRLFPLSDDLDSVYQELRTFRAEGGGDQPESVNQALADAIHRMPWSTAPTVVRVVFLVGDAPPHMDYEEVKYPETCNRARERGIVINAIQCGTDARCARHARAIAARTGGQYAVLRPAGNPIPGATPHDQRLAEINGQLARTALVYGPRARQAADRRKLGNVEGLGTCAAADRAGYLARQQRVAAFDLLDDARAGKVDLERLPAEEGPDELRGSTPVQKQQSLHELSRRRAGLLEEALGLDRKRQAARAPGDFEALVLSILRQQARKQIRY